MSFESGLGSNSSPYEYAVDVKNRRQKLKKVGFIAAYALYVIVVFVVGAIVKLILPLLAFVPLSTWILVWLTWKYTQLSYEYSFFKGELTVKRVFGTNKKSTLANVKIKELIDVRYCNGQNMSDISADKVIFAASSESAERLAVATWKNEQGEKTALYFEADEKAMKILHYYNSAIDISQSCSRIAYL